MVVGGNGLAVIIEGNERRARDAVGCFGHGETSFSGVGTKLFCAVSECNHEISLFPLAMCGDTKRCHTVRGERKKVGEKSPRRGAAPRSRALAWLRLAVEGAQMRPAHHVQPVPALGLGAAKLHGPREVAGGQQL